MKYGNLMLIFQAKNQLTKIQEKFFIDMIIIDFAGWDDFFIHKPANCLSLKYERKCKSRKKRSKSEMRAFWVKN
uniref:Uncharacterized protein n=1 Tax=Glossina morsitans morsitans TaxID=37546 RepID=A0A1B0FBK7_GLOMM